MKQADIVTFYGAVRITSLVPNNAEANGVSHYRVNTSYINNTRRIIRAKFRSNMEISCPKVAPRQSYSQEETFIVRKELTVCLPGIEKMREYFVNLPEVHGELDMFRKAYLQVYQNVYQLGQTRELKCTIEYTFTETDLNSKGGIFYHDQLDTLFKFDDTPFPIPHPHSEEGRKVAWEESAQLINDEQGFVFWVEIIDNQGRYGERFMSICNQIYKIVPKHDKNRQDGLYIVSSRPTNGRIAEVGVQTRMYSLDNIEKELGIYATFELAKTNGDVVSARKKELLDRQHEIDMDKQELAKERLRLERENAELERARREIDVANDRSKQHMEEVRNQQQHIMRMQEMHAKDRLEQRSSERKDSSEFIKFLPTILTGIGTILMFWKAFLAKPA